MKSSNWLLLLPLLLLLSNSVSAGELIVGIAIASNDHVYVWHKDGMVTSGTSGHFERYDHARPYSLPPGKTVSNIVAISIAKSDDHVYAWYDDGTVSSGTSTDLDKYRPLYKYTLPPGKTVKSVVGIGIAKDDRVYAWYDDITFSIGTTDDLDKHHAPEFYSLPPGKIAASIVEIDIAQSNDHVYAWYTDGTASSGSSKHLDSHRPTFGYVPAQVLYRWWGPEPVRRRHPESSVTDAPSLDHDGSTISDKYSGLIDEILMPAGRRPQPEPGDDPAEAGTGQSPAYATRFLPGSGPVDPMLAVGNQYLIVSTTGSIAFFDRLGNPLPAKKGTPTSMSTNEFFAGFTAKTNADGGINESNINRYLGFPKPCDSAAYPQTSSGNRFCIATFYDTRVFFDSTSKRFFIISNSRHALWNTGKYGGCGHYIVDLTDVADPSKCDVIKNGSCIITTTKENCDLTRRYVAFAVSKTEDPRDGFHQYMLLESNNRDWPWMTVNGNHFVVTHKGDFTTHTGEGEANSPVATIFSVNALKTGEQHPPYFRYYSEDVSGIKSVLPPTHHQNAAGLTFLLGRSKGKRLDIFALPQMNDPWTAPALLKTFVNLSSDKPSVVGAVYRIGKLYLVGGKSVEEKGEAVRTSVRVVRIPVEKLGASIIKASNDSSKGFLDHAFGRNATSDAPGDRLSYAFPAVAVNKRGDMLFGYGRFPFISEKPFKPEARYSLWYSGETKQRRSFLLLEGKSVNSDTSIDYTTAVVDPSDDMTFWVALPYAESSTRLKTVVGKISP